MTQTASREKVGTMGMGMYRTACAAMLLIAWANVQSAAAAPGTSQAANRVVGVTATHGEPDKQGGPILVRELVRQSLLIAARDELGISTRDQTLRDAMPANDNVLDVTVFGLAPLKLRVTRQNGSAKPLFDGTIEGETKYTFDDVPEIVAAAERYSRGKFVDLLRESGFTGQVKRSAGAPMVPGVEAKLAEMEMLAQFAAVRETHDAIRASGESPARLGALVRGYVNLGQLTSFHWTAAHKAFKARALLYAQRMVVADPASPDALWHRAYARALTGLHAAALLDLDAATKLGAGKPPAWVSVIAPLCRYDTGKLTDLAVSEPASAPLAMYCAFLTVEHSRSQGATMNVAQIAFELSPECLRIVDNLCQHTGPGMLNLITENGPRLFSLSLGKRLPAMPKLPASIVKLIEQNRRPGGNPQGRVLAVNALVKAAGSDAGEPSWAVLGRLIQETTFVQTWRRADLVGNKWGQDAGEFVDVVLPNLGDHPYKPYIEMLGLPRSSSAAQRRKLLQTIELVDDQRGMRPMINAMSSAGMKKDAAGRELWQRAFDRMDAVAPDEEVTLVMYATNISKFKTFHVKRLMRISPHAPLGMAMMIFDDWKTAQPHVAGWEAEHGGHPTLAKALAIRYAADKRWADAERCLKTYIEVAQDRSGYDRLAEVYKAQGRLDDYVATLKAFLDQRDYGLQHANVQVKLANHYMAQRDWASAVRYAEEASETGAGWAMRAAADAHAGAGDWAKAEKWIRQSAEHYDHPDDWFRWCVRTGKGNRAAARRAALDQLKAHQARDPEGTRLKTVAFHLLDGDANSAIEPLKTLTDKGNVWAGLHLALIHGASGDVAACDAALAAVVAAGDDADKYPRAHNRRVRVATLVHDARSAGGAAVKLDVHAIEKILVDLSPEDRADTDYFVAGFLEQSGQAKDAEGYLVRCATAFKTDFTNVALAWVKLRAAGTDPMDFPMGFEAPATQPSRNGEPYAE